jgi:hypothetical protein
VKQAGFWSRAAATVTAFLTLVSTVIGSLQKAESLEEGAVELGSWDTLMAIIKEHPLGTTIAVILIGANVIVFVKATKKSTTAA